MFFRSITFKFLATISLLTALLLGATFYFYGKTESVPILVVNIVTIGYGLLIICIFLFTISAPIFRIVRQIKFLLTGKKYRRLRPSSSDEIGVITHFFNKITLSLESISGDIVEKKRLTSELDVAQKIQTDVFPKKAPAILGLDIVARSRPAAEMGGDSFDFLQQEHNALMYIGDVTGHGVPAGLIMMMVNTLIHAFAKHDMYPSEILTQVNSILYHRISAHQFMTMVMLRWDEKRQKMFFVGAGHEYILVYRAKDKSVERIVTGGIALRMTPDIGAFMQEKDIHLDDNDVILLYSDGITEGKNPRGEMFTVMRLIESLKSHGFRSSAEKIFDAITKEFSDFMGDYVQQDDDITMIVIKKLSAGESSRTPIKLTIGGIDQNKKVEGGGRRWEWVG
jgi:hypothetical protein